MERKMKSVENGEEEEIERNRDLFGLVGHMVGVNVQIESQHNTTVEGNANETGEINQLVWVEMKAAAGKNRAMEMKK